MKYWEIIADNLKKAGWSLGWVSAVDSHGQTIWIANAHRGDGKRFVVQEDEKADCVSGTGSGDLGISQFPAPVQNIASTPGAHLLYSAYTFDSDGAIRVLSRDSFKLTKRLSNMDWPYYYFVQC